MADKPILFSGPMARALLAGTKTQTRRPMKEWFIEPRMLDRQAEAKRDERAYWVDGGVPLFPPRIAVGDRLYVREAWRTTPGCDDLAPRDLIPHLMPVHYEADGDVMPWPTGIPGRFRQGMHMPRWASRLTLTVTEVRVQRLQEISREDSEAEGVQPYTPPVDQPPEEKYRALWEAINGPGSWAVNPWVAAYTFTVERRNIDI